jgi:hypothetical protein
MAEWWYCLDHGTVEPADTKCFPDRRLGPFDSPEAARNWRETYKERDNQWEREDAEWEGREPDQ